MPAGGASPGSHGGRGGVYVGIDVGTGSARAGLFDAFGRMQGTATHSIETWRPEADFVEQSSDDIWRACIFAVRGALREAGVDPDRVRGVGFDATCSLVALDKEGRPVTVSPTGRDEQNVIVWMDHRAIDQASRVNATDHPVLRYVGGKISPEMESPKLLWVKENLPRTWSRARHFFDLPDFLTYRATGDETRSLCSTVCKWTYQGHEEAPAPDSVGRWDESYWKEIGLEELAEDRFQRIGQRVRPLGEAVGRGLTPRAAEELGLPPGTPVGVSIIDAHAGGLGMLGARLSGEELSPETLERRLALIGGTSSCHMAVSRKPKFVPGVWGPYFSAMIPGLWLNEGGQSATGALIDHVIFSHARASELEERARSTGESIYALLNARVREMAQGFDSACRLTRNLHLLPDFHGNRSPRADPSSRGMISGLTLSGTVDDLALLYLAAIQAIAHGTRHIIDTMRAHGYRIDTVFACGGGTRNPLFLREHADVTGCRIILPREPETVLLGSAILGAVASGAFESIQEAMAAMSGSGERIRPAGGEIGAYHEAKHAVFLRMYEDQQAYADLMDPSPGEG